MDTPEVQKEKICCLSDELINLLDNKYTASEACLAMAAVMRILLNKKDESMQKMIREMIREIIDSTLNNEVI